MNSEDLNDKIVQQVKQWQQSQEHQTSGYEYEKSFTQLGQKLGQEVFQSSLGEGAYQKNSKKKPPRPGPDAVGPGSGQ